MISGGTKRAIMHPEHRCAYQPKCLEETTILTETQIRTACRAAQAEFRALDKAQIAALPPLDKELAEAMFDFDATLDVSPQVDQAIARLNAAEDAKADAIREQQSAEAIDIFTTRKPGFIGWCQNVKILFESTLTNETTEAQRRSALRHLTKEAERIFKTDKPIVVGFRGITHEEEEKYTFSRLLDGDTPEAVARQIALTAYCAEATEENLARYEAALIADEINMDVERVILTAIKKTCSEISAMPPEEKELTLAVLESAHFKGSQSRRRDAATEAYRRTLCAKTEGSAE
jgi:hypothetical protein